MNRASRLVLLAAGLTVLAGTGSCTTVTRYAVGEAVGAVTGEDVDLADDGDEGSGPAGSPLGGGGAGTGSQAAVYEAGPTPGWERGFRVRGGMGSAPYRNRVCVNIPLRLDLGRLWSRELPDPFESSDQLDRPLFQQENNQGIDPDYTRFGEVGLGGPSAVATARRSTGVFGRDDSTGVACSAFGVLSFGRTSPLALILR